MKRGFTLAELLVALAILGLMMVGILTLLMSGNQSYLTGSNQVEAQAGVRAALERLTADLREAGYSPTSQVCTAAGVPAGCWVAIDNPTDTQFAIQYDWNGNGAPQAGVQVPVSYVFGGIATNMDRGELVTYSVAGGNLTRQESVVDAQPQILATSVQPAIEGGAAQPYFQYLDAGGTVLANPAANREAIRTIVVRMSVGAQNQPPVTWQAGAVQVTMADRIRLRNLQ